MPQIDWHKIGRRSRSKGNAYERRVAAMMTQLTGKKWVRTPSSGGMSWRGDVICTEQTQRVLIECKNRRISLTHEINHNYPNLRKWAAAYTEEEQGRLYFVLTVKETTGWHVVNWDYCRFHPKTCGMTMKELARVAL